MKKTKGKFPGKTIFLSVVICVCAVLALPACRTENAGAGPDFALAGDLADGSILHCFSWDFRTIRLSLPDIAAAGFSAVQTSPANACLAGEDGGMDLYGHGKWYYHYQPVDWKTGNYQLGSREEFRLLCAEAERCGIRVLVDVAPNHTTPEISAVSPGLVQAAGGMDRLYHKGAAKRLTNYGDRLQCTTYSMGGLPDVNTENPGFQAYFFAYLHDLIDCGADGFRFDTAKHIGLPDDPKEDDGLENDFWPNLRASLKDEGPLFLYGELLHGPNDRLADYIEAIGAVTASAYGIKLRSAVTSGRFSAATLGNFFAGGETERLVTWVESHDNYINDGNWAVMDENDVVLGYAVAAARKGGTPLFFSRPYGSDRQNRWGSMNRIGCAGSDGYKDPRVRAVNFFRIEMAGEDEALSEEAGGSVLVIRRGKKGAVLVNGGGEVPVDFALPLRNGEYTDRVTGARFQVRGGRLTAETPLPAHSVTVLTGKDWTERPAQIFLAAEGEFRFPDENPLPVILRARNAEQAFWSLDGAPPVPFTDGTQVEIPPGADGTAVLTLTASGTEGQTSFREFVYSSVGTGGTKKTGTDG